LSKITDFPIPIFELWHSGLKGSAILPYFGILMIFKQEFNNAA